MLKSFTNMQMKQVRCLIIEEKGVFKSEYNNIDELLDKNIDCIKIYNPNKDQKQEIIKYFGDNINLDEKLKVEVNDKDFMFKLLKELSDIDFEGLNLETDKDKIYDILDNPDEVLIKIKIEIEKMLFQLFINWLETINLMKELPNKMQDIIINQAKIDKIENK